MNFLATQAPMKITINLSFSLYNLSFVLLHACHEERLYKYPLTLFYYYFNFLVTTEAVCHTIKGLVLSTLDKIAVLFK